jgi:hypothetical protein
MDQNYNTYVLELESALRAAGALQREVKEYD